MNRHRRRRAARWPRIAAVAAAAVVAVLLVILIARLFSGALRLARGGTGGRDPQFAEPAEAVTRPPELRGEGGYILLEDDPSAEWEQAEQTPVDKTAEELMREAEASD